MYCSVPLHYGECYGWVDGYFLTGGMPTHGSTNYRKEREKLGRVRYSASIKPELPLHAGAVSRFTFSVSGLEIRGLGRLTGAGAQFFKMSAKSMHHGEMHLGLCQRIEPPWQSRRETMD